MPTLKEYLEAVTPTTLNNVPQEVIYTITVNFSPDAVQDYDDAVSNAKQAEAAVISAQASLDNAKIAHAGAGPNSSAVPSRRRPITRSRCSWLMPPCSPSAR